MRRFKIYDDNSLKGIKFVKLSIALKYVEVNVCNVTSNKILLWKEKSIKKITTQTLS